MTIRPIETADKEAVWAILQSVIQAGDAYAFNPDSDKETMMNYWVNADKFTYVVEIEEQIAGSFYIKTNQPGLGSHVCNAGYMTDMRFRGRGLAEAMCRFSLVEAKALGYQAMQYNLVVSTNEVAVRIWQKCGFEIVGRLPKAFNHQQLGLVDAFVMYRFL